ncbi:hypothetical protein ACJMK2_002344 [Sinanodonta woodiana]|uniref:Uncharacterized protein n=1 Tax=Sinanodonta woodiana TaxID=1069815 RepID=A0ABD3XY07_SINWO
MTVAAESILLPLCLLLLVSRFVNCADYSTYVWTTSFDNTVSGCDETKFLAWDSASNPECFTHSWNTEAKRTWLWNTCNVTGAEIKYVYLSDLKNALKAAWLNNNCQTSDINLVRTTVADGHTKVPGLKLYALFADSDLAVTEKTRVRYVVYYNDHCAQSAQERIDGVAVNNEAYAGIKCSDNTTRTTYLNNLNTIKTEAALQLNGTLLTHYSVGWHWGLCNDLHDPITFNGKTADAVVHMIDIFNSVDVQVGAIIFPDIADRMVIAQYNYAVNISKPIFTTVYTNKVSICGTSFFPVTCNKGTHTEAGMLDIFSQFGSNGIGQAKPCIHYFRGIYSTGGNSDWPKHN